jgi:UDP-apiose/xylose synthase
MFCVFAAGRDPERRESVLSQAFNVGNAANEVPVAELAQLMRSVYASLKGIPESAVPGVEIVSGEEYYGKGYDDSLRRLPSVEKAERLLGFKAKIPLKEALEESLRWFINHYSTHETDVC